MNGFRPLPDWKDRATQCVEDTADLFMNLNVGASLRCIMKLNNTDDRTGLQVVGGSKIVAKKKMIRIRRIAVLDSCRYSFQQ